MLGISAGNNIDLIYGKNYDTDKYEMFGIRIFNAREEEDGTYFLKIEDIDSLILGAQQLKKDLLEFNNQ